MIKKIREAYSKLWNKPLGYESQYEILVYRNALKDLMNELNLLGEKKDE